MTPLPGSLCWPGVSETWAYQRHPIEFFRKRHERHGDVFATRLRGIPTVVFGGTGGVAAIFQAERGHLEVANTALVHELFGRAVFNLTGEDHLRARRTLLLALNGASLRGYGPMALDLACEHVGRWAAGGISDLYQATRELTLDACVRILMGIDNDAPEGAEFRAAFEVFVAGTNVASEFRYITSPYWRARAAAFDLRRLIHRRAECARLQPRADVLSRLARDVDADRGPFYTSLPDHMLALLVAARETTASLITWSLIEIARDERSVAAVSEEARGICLEALARPHHAGAPLLRAALLEAERLHSPNAISLRRVVKDCRIGGHDLHRDWHAAYSPAANHFDPTLYNAPFAFRPQRFLTTTPSRNDAGLLTFGGGVHACPGRLFAELLTLAVAATVFGKFHMYFMEGYPARARYLPVKAPAEPVPVMLRPIRGAK